MNKIYKANSLHKRQKRERSINQSPIKTSERKKVV